jgi:hypothetical protein
MSEVKLSWSSAEVDDAQLTVPLDGDIPRRWREDFETTVRRLGRGEWGEVEVKKDKVRVSDVTPGSEDKLRHHLESIVTQANAAHEAREREKAGEGREDGQQREEDEGEKRQGPDAEMTARFRAFGGDESAEREGENADSEE